MKQHHSPYDKATCPHVKHYEDIRFGGNVDHKFYNLKKQSEKKGLRQEHLPKNDMQLASNGTSTNLEMYRHIAY